MSDQITSIIEKQNIRVFDNNLTVILESIDSKLSGPSLIPRPLAIFSFLFGDSKSKNKNSSLGTRLE